MGKKKKKYKVIEKSKIEWVGKDKVGRTLILLFGLVYLLFTFIFAMGNIFCPFEGIIFLIKFIGLIGFLCIDFYLIVCLATQKRWFEVEEIK